MQVKDKCFGSWALYLNFGTCYEVNSMKSSMNTVEK